MCDVNRWRFLAGGAALLSLPAERELRAGPSPAEPSAAGPVDQVAPDVYFHAGTLSDTRITTATTPTGTRSSSRTEPCRSPTRASSRR